MPNAEYNRKYQAQNIVQKKVLFNRQSDEDLALLDWVELQDNFSRLCKDLLRTKMKEESFQGYSDENQ